MIRGGTRLRRSLRISTSPGEKLGLRFYHDQRKARYDSSWNSTYRGAASALCFGSIYAALNTSIYSDSEPKKGEEENIERRFSEQEIGPEAVAMKRFAKKSHPCTSYNEYQSDCPELVIFSGNAHNQLAKDIAKNMGRSVGKSRIGKFNDGEISVKFLESVRGKDIYIIQPIGPPVNENIVELLLMTSALRSSSAKRVTVVIPYYAYLRKANVTSKTIRKLKQPKIDTGEVVSVEASNLTASLAGSDVARMIEASGATRVITVDMQPPGQDSATGFFRKAQVELVRSYEFVVDTLAEVLNLKELTKERELVIVGTHASCITMAKMYQQRLESILDAKIGVATIIRTPPPPGSGSSKPKIELVGKVKNKVVLLVGDVIDTGSTTCSAADVVKAAGASNVFAFASHPILSRGAAARLNESELEKLVVLDTVPVPTEKHEKCPKLEQISIAQAIAEKIEECHFQPKDI